MCARDLSNCQKAAAGDSLLSVDIELGCDFGVGELDRAMHDVALTVVKRTARRIGNRSGGFLPRNRASDLLGAVSADGIPATYGCSTVKNGSLRLPARYIRNTVSWRRKVSWLPRDRRRGVF
jgi:hypothetical protein